MTLRGAGLDQVPVAHPTPDTPAMHPGAPPRGTPTACSEPDNTHAAAAAVAVTQQPVSPDDPATPATHPGNPDKANAAAVAGKQQPISPDDPGATRAHPLVATPDTHPGTPPPASPAMHPGTPLRRTPTACSEPDKTQAAAAAVAVTQQPISPDDPATPDTHPGHPDKTNAAAAVAELKNGKVSFKQKPLALDGLSETMQEIVNFRALLAASDGALAAVPPAHLPLIAKLVHESDKSAGALVRALQATLGAALPAAAVEHAIRAVAERVNYGIGGAGAPAALCVWRWEVRDRAWLPACVRARAGERVEERVAARTQLQAVFAGLSAEERDALLRGGRRGRALQGAEGAGQPPAQLSVQDRNGEAPRSHEPKKPGRPKKAVDAEVVEKEKDKQEKKAVKAEKEKKDAEATKRSAALLVNFFKPGGSAKTSKSSGDDPAPVPGSSTAAHLSDFEATFKPFVVKKDAQLAPINWFAAERLKKRKNCRGPTDSGKRDVIFELDEEGRDVNMWPEQCVPMDTDRKEPDFSSVSPRELLCAFLDSQPPSLRPLSRPPYRKASQSGPTYRVREIVHRLGEAEVHGDQRTVRKLTALLKDRRKIPAKVFVFTENIRPGYLGTWTRTTSSIGPTAPFTRDLLSFDYDHDSDAEWEEEGDEEGEDVDSPDESMEDDVSSVASDLDGWLVGGDVIELESNKVADELHSPLASSNKRKAAGTRPPSNKKRKVVPLVPFQKGPIWETALGRCEYEPFRPMRIQLLNDTPVAVDPFTFVSSSVVLPSGAPCAAKKDPARAFVVPTLPERLLAATSPAAGEAADDTREAKRKAAAAPKTTFPDAHVALVLQKIAASNTNSFVVLLDSIFQDVKPLGVKKNALEVKLREVAEKDKAKKGWVVREDAWARHGLAKSI